LKARLNPEEVMKKTIRRIAHCNPPNPKTIVPTRVAATAPLLLRLWTRYARKAMRIARLKP
jgi:hypothetical protein